VGDAIEERGRHLGIAEHAGPLAERQVGGDDHRRLLVKLADQVEQQLATRTGERQITKLVEHHELVAAQLGRERAGLADPRLLLELRHQIDGVEVGVTARK